MCSGHVFSIFALERIKRAKLVLTIYLVWHLWVWNKILCKNDKWRNFFNASLSSFSVIHFQSPVSIYTRLILHQMVLNWAKLISITCSESSTIFSSTNNMYINCSRWRKLHVLFLQRETAHAPEGLKLFTPFFYCSIVAAENWTDKYSLKHLLFYILSQFGCISGQKKIQFCNMPRLTLNTSQNVS